MAPGPTTGLVDLNEEQAAVVQMVREFVDKDVIPVADELEHRDEFPDEIVDGMKKLGLFGLTVPEEYGGGRIAVKRLDAAAPAGAGAWDVVGGEGAARAVKRRHHHPHEHQEEGLWGGGDHGARLGDSSRAGGQPPTERAHF